MEHTLSQLIDIEQIRLLLEAHHKITGIASAVVDAEDRVLAAVGWGDPSSSHDGAAGETALSTPQADGAVAIAGRPPRTAEWEMALPIVIEEKHLGALFTGKLSGAPEAAPSLLPGCTRTLTEKGPSLPEGRGIRHQLDFFQVLVQMMAQMGGSALKLARAVEDRREAERSHRESREFLEKIVNSISDPIFVKDREHRLVLVNEAICTLAGVRREDLVGRSNYEISLANEVDVLWETDEAVFATGRETASEEELIDAQGGRRVVLTRKSLYYGANGESYLVGILRDITERKRAEEDIALLNFALDNVHEAAYLMDEQARILYVNDAACRALGYLREELLCMRLPEIAVEHPQEHWTREWNALKEVGCLTFESRHRTRSGRIFPVRITANYFEYDRTGYTLALASDLTDLTGVTGRE